MKILRWILGGVLALYALLSAVTVVGFATAYKLGLMAADKPELKKIEPYMAGVSWFELALGSLTVILLALAAWRLFTGGRALLVFLAAFVVDLATWLIMSSSEAYQAAFTAEERSADYVVIGVMALIGLAIWWTERRRA
ncbi:MAG: hypothetical protein ACK4RV_04145 [Caulobacter sp.]|jgi:hypothetical protein